MIRKGSLPTAHCTYVVRVLGCSCVCVFFVAGRLVAQYFLHGSVPKITERLTKRHPSEPPLAEYLSQRVMTSLSAALLACLRESPLPVQPLQFIGQSLLMQSHHHAGLHQPTYHHIG